LTEKKGGPPPISFNGPIAAGYLKRGKGKKRKKRSPGSPPSAPEEGGGGRDDPFFFLPGASRMTLLREGRRGKRGGREGGQTLGILPVPMPCRADLTEWRGELDLNVTELVVLSAEKKRGEEGGEKRGGGRGKRLPPFRAYFSKSPPSGRKKE